MEVKNKIKKETTVDKIIKFLKANKNKWFDNQDICKNIGISKENISWRIKLCIAKDSHIKFVIKKSSNGSRKIRYYTYDDNFVIKCNEE